MCYVCFENHESHVEPDIRLKNTCANCKNERRILFPCTYLENNCNKFYCFTCEYLHYHEKKLDITII